MNEVKKQPTNRIGRIIAVVLACGFAAVCISVAFFLRGCSRAKDAVSVTSSKTVEMSASEVRSIRETGEWEFLSVTTEELAELHEGRILGDRDLVCIYRGTLRLGVDLRRAGEDWFTAKGDSAILRLPAISLLSHDFIDEARTTTFYEKGTWDAAAKKQLYEKARKQMLARCMTPQNIEAARQNAENQMSRFFASFGFQGVRIEWEK